MKAGKRGRRDKRVKRGERGEEIEDGGRRSAGRHYKRGRGRGSNGRRPGSKRFQRRVCGLFHGSRGKGNNGNLITCAS